MVMPPNTPPTAPVVEQPPLPMNQGNQSCQPPLPEEERKKVPVKKLIGNACIVTFVFIVVNFILSNLTALLYSLGTLASGAFSFIFSEGYGSMDKLYSGVLSNSAWIYPVSNLVSILASGGAALIVATRIIKLDEKIEYAFKEKTDFKTVVNGICLSSVFIVPIRLIAVLLFTFVIRKSLPHLVEGVASSYYGFESIILSFLTNVILTPLILELIFRGYILKSLQKYSASFAIVFSAVLYATISLNIVEAISSFLFGLVLGWIYVKTNSLRTVIAIHVIDGLVLMMFSTAPIGNLLPIIGFVLSIAMLVYGFVLLVKQHKELGQAIHGNQESRNLWKIAMNQPWFWIVVALLLFLG